MLDLYNTLSTKSKALLRITAMLIIVAALDFALDFSLTELEDAMEALSAFFTVVTIIVGGTWTYLLFVRG